MKSPQLRRKNRTLRFRKVDRTMLRRRKSLAIRAVTPSTTPGPVYTLMLLGV